MAKSYVYICLHNIMNIWNLAKEIFPPIENTVGICKQIIILIFDTINSRPSSQQI